MPRGKRLKPSKEQLEHYIYDLKMKPKEIADHLGYANGETNIYRYCREYGLEFNFYPNAELRKIPFSDKQKSVIIGNVLGDGYLHPNTNDNYYLNMTHSIKQIDYLEWKKSMLSPFVVSESPYRREHNGFGSKTTLISYNTVIHPWLRELRHMFYIDGKKVISPSILNMVDELALAVWFMDDGSLNRKYGTMLLSTFSFSYEENLLIQDWFLEKWGILVKLEKHKQRSGKETFGIRINRSVAPKLIEIISPFIIDSMKYKVSFPC